jgi:NADP-dependent 3-hydroxy acid dehydrogenase YdfG
MIDAADAHTAIRPLVEPGETGSTMQQPDISPEEQSEAIRAEEMRRAEDITVGVRHLLTRPRRTAVQQLVLVPRAQGGE